MLPDDGDIRPINIPNNVVFPAPFFPKTPVTEFSLTLNDIFLIIFFVSNVFTRFETLTTKLFTT